MISIFSGISKAFYLKIHLRVLVSESSTMSKLIQRFKPSIAKNEDSLVEIDSLLLTTNSAIASFSNQSSY